MSGALGAASELTWHQGFCILRAMDAVSQSELFPVIAEQSGKRSQLRVFMDAVERHGPLIGAE